MTFKDNIDEILAQYDLPEEQKMRFFARVNAIIKSDIPRKYVPELITALAFYIAKEQEREQNQENNSKSM